MDIPATPFRNVVEAALAGESYVAQQRADGVRLNVEANTAVTVFHTGTVHVLGDRLVERVKHLPGCETHTHRTIKYDTAAVKFNVSGTGHSRRAAERKPRMREVCDCGIERTADGACSLGLCD